MYSISPSKPQQPKNKKKQKNKKFPGHATDIGHRLGAPRNLHCTTHNMITMHPRTSCMPCSRSARDMYLGMYHIHPEHGVVPCSNISMQPLNSLVSSHHQTTKGGPLSPFPPPVSLSQITSALSPLPRKSPKIPSPHHTAALAFPLRRVFA